METTRLTDFRSLALLGSHISPLREPTRKGPVSLRFLSPTGNSTLTNCRFTSTPYQNGENKCSALLK